MHIKQFLEWIGLKEKLHFNNQKIPHVSEGQIWWASIGENIGFEINGKSELFTRPVIIFKKLSNMFYFVVPLTTKVHTGSWYVNYRHQGKLVTACLNQARPIDYRRLRSKIGCLDDEDYSKVKNGFTKLYL
ncbi:MAG: type II toxin-antitoxin system PemK/MazF family toxin [Candidatus Gracilibacteria bacterium]